MNHVKKIASVFPVLFLIAGMLLSSCLVYAPIEETSLRTVPLRIPEPLIPVTAKGRYHTVVRGENVYSIGRFYGVSPARIIALNRLPDSRYLEEGQILYISPES